MAFGRRSLSSRVRRFQWTRVVRVKLWKEEVEDAETEHDVARIGHEGVSGGVPVAAPYRRRLHLIVRRGLVRPPDRRSQSGPGEAPRVPSEHGVGQLVVRLLLRRAVLIGVVLLVVGRSDHPRRAGDLWKRPDGSSSAFPSHATPAPYYLP